MIFSENNAANYVVFLIEKLHYVNYKVSIIIIRIQNIFVNEVYVIYVYELLTDLK